MRDTIARALAILSVALAAGVLLVVLLAPRPTAVSATAPKPQARKVALDCSRPQGRHRWVVDSITPPSFADEGTTVRLSVKDKDGNTDITKLDIKGWLCVIDAEYPKEP